MLNTKLNKFNAFIATTNCLYDYDTPTHNRPIKFRIQIPIFVDWSTTFRARCPHWNRWHPNSRTCCRRPPTGTTLWPARFEHLWMWAVVVDLCATLATSIRTIQDDSRLEFLDVCRSECYEQLLGRIALDMVCSLKIGVRNEVGKKNY